MWCVDGVWVVMRAGVQASGAMIVWVGRSVYSLCGASGVGGGQDAWGSLRVVCFGAPAGVGGVCLFFVRAVCVLVVLVMESVTG